MITMTHDHQWLSMLFKSIQLRFIWTHWHNYDQLLPVTFGFRSFCRNDGAFTLSYGRFQGVAGVGCRFRNQIHTHNNTDRGVSHACPQYHPNLNISSNMRCRLEFVLLLHMTWRFKWVLFQCNNSNTLMFLWTCWKLNKFWTIDFRGFCLGEEFSNS